MLPLKSMSFGIDGGLLEKPRVADGCENDSIQTDNDAADGDKIKIRWKKEKT